MATKKSPRSKSKPRSKGKTTGRAGKAGKGTNGSARSRANGDAGPWQAKPGEVGIRVRMYRVGFGDFFLLSFLDGAGKPLHVVIDCGVFKGTSQTGDIGSIEAAVADMAATTGGEIALIVMTHRHADHIAGFARCSAIYKTMKVGAVWMPIWESEYEPKAVKFQAALDKTALALRSHFAGLRAANDTPIGTARKYMENATGESGGGSNANALKLLKQGLGVSPEYYKAGDKAKLPQPLSAAGLACEVLGPPPIDDLDLMKLMDLQKGVGQYLSANAEDDEAEIAPFGPEWEVQPAPESPPDQNGGYTAVAFREWMAKRAWNTKLKGQTKDAMAKMERVLDQMRPIAALTAAKQLNAFLNNQSLVLHLTFKGKRLLFVGDAQAGNWEHWLFGTDQPDKKAGGQIPQLAREVLGGVHFYKVGHHGSGNATPKAAVELMCGHDHPFVAMCSTEDGVYGTENPDDPTKGTEVPRAPLLERLAQQASLVRSDQVPIEVPPKTIKATVNAPWPKSPGGARLEKGAIWVDCFL